MKKNTQNKCKMLILAVIFILIIVISSCTDTNSSPVLCNVKLDYNNSRDFNNIKLSSELTNSTLHYKAIYLGSGSSYGAKSNFVEYPEGGLILSQGLWRIDCRWMNGDILIAEGTTRDIWVNLNTTSIIVYLEENVGKGSFSLESYKVKCSDNSVSSVNVQFEIQEWTSNGFAPTDTIVTLTPKEPDSNDCIYSFDLAANNIDAGHYILVLKVFDSSSQSASDLLFTDLLGFIVREGHKTKVEGDCAVKKGTSSSNSEYMDGYYDDEKNQPIDSNKVIPVGETTTNKTNLSKENIQNNHIYVINESSDGSDSMNLGHSGSGSSLTNQSDRIITPEPEEGKIIDFGINLNGTNVVVTTYTPYPWELIFNSEQTTIVSLKSNVTMNLYNKVNPPDLKNPAVWGKGGEFKRRYHSNVSLEGGSLNVIGPSSNNISNEPIIFRGPQYFDSNTGDTGGTGSYYKQGTVNVSSPGGSIVFDGEVTVEGFVGISSWNADMGPTSTIEGTSNTNITLKNGATIFSEGDVHYENFVNYSDTAYGIKLVGVQNSSTGTINIVLDNGHIETTNDNKKDTNEAGIYIENFAGDINITLQNGSSIKTNGAAIMLKNCTGPITISVESGCTVNSDIIVNSKTMELKKDTDGKLKESKKQSYNTSTI